MTRLCITRWPYVGSAVSGPALKSQKLGVACCFKEDGLFRKEKKWNPTSIEVHGKTSINFNRVGFLLRSPLSKVLFSVAFHEASHEEFLDSGL